MRARLFSRQDDNDKKVAFYCKRMRFEVNK